MASVVKDIGEIWTRLFDHRPFLNGEIKYFLREFEEKRSDREVAGLFQILETVTDIKDLQIDRLKLAADAHLPPLSIKLDTAQTKCDAILDRETVFRSDKTLEKQRKLRSCEWEKFIEDITEKCAKVDEAFAEKEKKLKEQFADLENQFLPSPSTI